jgi:RNA polymerase sigma-70 factor (ECF subfamily)
MSGAPVLAPEREAALLAAIRGPSETTRQTAFQELFTAFHAPLLGLCAHLTADRAEAEDALQEVFLALHRALPGFRGESKLSTWVYRIALRTALQVRARRPRDTTSLDAQSPAMEVPDAGVAPDRLASARQESARLARAMERLSPEHRAVLSLFALEGLSHAEVAEALGIPLGTVWSRLHLARKKLLAALDEQDGKRVSAPDA